MPNLWTLGRWGSKIEEGYLDPSGTEGGMVVV